MKTTAEIYKDAKSIGIQIICKIKVIDTYETAHLIVDSHSLRRNTYKLATEFLANRDKLIDEAPKDEAGEFENEYKLNRELDDLDLEFVSALSAEYGLLTTTD
jgi:hypothetical protein